MSNPTHPTPHARNYSAVVSRLSLKDAGVLIACIANVETDRAVVWATWIKGASTSSAVRLFDAVEPAVEFSRAARRDKERRGWLPQNDTATKAVTAAELDAGICRGFLHSLSFAALAHLGMPVEWANGSRLKSFATAPVAGARSIGGSTARVHRDAPPDLIRPFVAPPPAPEMPTPAEQARNPRYGRFG